MDRLSCAFEAKFAADGSSTGSFEGYASVFGGLDSYGDTIVPGAFRQTLAALSAQGRSLPMYFNHGARLGADGRPVGVWTSVAEDGQGLRVEGKLAGLDTETGRYNLALMKEGAMRGLSIGFNVPKGGASYGAKPGEPRRTLKTINLHEISVVDDPADPNARITALKSSLELLSAQDWRDVEAVLRDEGLSRADAVKAVSGLKVYLQRDAGEPDQEPRDEVAAAELRSLAERIRGLAA
jgi:HK97 family phage prohead protease